MVNYFLHNVVPNERKLPLTRPKTTSALEGGLHSKFPLGVEHLHITCGSPQMKILIIIFKRVLKRCSPIFILWNKCLFENLKYF